MREQVWELQALAERCRELRAQGQVVVLTNGCFDLLHVGHVRYLRQARALGDVLVVAVNSDASVRALKGPGRPIVPEAQRAEVVASLAAVDYVTVFDGLTAEQVVETLRPNIYVKGGDYAIGGARIPEARVVVGYGGLVCLLDLEPEMSTTKLLERAADSQRLRELLPTTGRRIPTGGRAHAG